MGERASIIIFHRGQHFYPTQYPRSYSDWAAEAERNPGTTKITTVDGVLLWPTPSDPRLRGDTAPGEVSRG
jgi:hypothetical protein